ncbi:D-alanine transaminase [Alteribacillus persepolensis]|uniref:D-alanine aminotransferase n=2 Tax=Alteribacillus persepolensis TaxID=568899 RepID=A0A1G8CY07_9BACI|nr:D-alanine transaminase [Alteribacillus persepolensis]
MEYVWLKNHILPKSDAYVHFDDRGYYFGDGIYEVIRIYNHQPFLLDAHMERFARSAHELDMPLPYSLSSIKDKTKELITKNDINNGYVYIQMTRGEQPRDHLYSRDITPVMTGFTKKREDGSTQKEGISLWTTKDIRWLRCDIKTINLLGNVMAKRQAEDHACQEALLHRDGIVTEGSSSNIFMVKRGVLYTHPANHYILNGITRQYTIAQAKQLDICVNETAFSLEQLQEADEVFATSTSLEVTPVHQIKGDIDMKIKTGPVTEQLQQGFSFSC